MNENRYVKYVLFRNTVLEPRLSSFLFFVVFFTTLSASVGWFINKQLEKIWKRLWPYGMLYGHLAWGTEVNHGNHRPEQPVWQQVFDSCMSQIHVQKRYAICCRQWMPCVLRDCYGSGTSVAMGDTNSGTKAWAKETDRVLLWGGIRNMFWVFLQLVWYLAAPVMHFE